MKTILLCFGFALLLSRIQRVEPALFISSRVRGLQCCCLSHSGSHPGTEQCSLKARLQHSFPWGLKWKSRGPGGGQK
jgi:hypothetical protein